MLFRNSKICISVILILSLLIPFFARAVPAEAAVGKPVFHTVSQNILIGRVFTFKVINKPAKAQYTWTTSNKKVALVTKNGAVKGLKKGKATLTCKIKAAGKVYRLKAAITVIKPAQKIRIKNPVRELTVGDTYDLNRTLLPRDSNDRTFWTSSNKKIASPDKLGRFTALKAGTVTITARTLSKKTARITIHIKERTAPAPFPAPSSVPSAVTPGSNDGDTRKDSDGDGLPDAAEQLCGTDPFCKDTDGDGLYDGDEVFLSGTDPLTADSDGSGITDGLKDSDGDGLANSEEIRRGTSPVRSDSDEDGLHDGDEVNLYGTDPLTADTDGDGLEDGDEILLGFHPLEADSDGDGIPDSREKVNQTFTAAMEEAERPGVTQVSINLDASGNLNKTTVIESVWQTDALSSKTAGLLGVPVEITTEAEFDTALLTFAYDDTLLGSAEEEDLRIMWFDEENYRYVLLDDECTVDTVNHTVSCSTTHFSTYLLVDRAAWYAVWEEFWLRFHARSGPNNLLLYMEASSSMDEAAYRRQEAAIRQIAGSMGGDDRAFLFCTGFYIDGGTVHPLNGQELARLAEKTTQELTDDPHLADQNMNETLNDAADQLSRIYVTSDRKITQVVLFSSGITAPVFSHEERRPVDKMNRMGAQLHTVKTGTFDDNHFLKYLTEINDNKGSYQDVSGGTGLSAEAYFPAADRTDSDGDGLYDSYETEGMVLPNGTCITSDPLNADTDGDGIRDGEEMGSLVPIQTKVFGTSCDMLVYQLLSNPSKKDSDQDGIPDQDDAHPNKAFCKTKKGSVETTKWFPKYIVGEFGPDELRSDYIDNRLIKEQKLFRSEPELYLKDKKKYNNIIDKAYTMAAIGFLTHMFTASEYLKHYLNRSGTKKDILVYDILYRDTGYKYFKENVNNLLQACENGIKSGATVSIATNRKVKYGGSRFDNTLWYLMSSLNEYLSVNCTDAMISAKCTNEEGLYKLELTFYITDVYDWDKGNNAAVYLVSAKDLFELKLIGSAMDFEIRGSATFSFQWKKGQRIGKGLIFDGYKIY